MRNVALAMISALAAIQKGYTTALRFFIVVDQKALSGCVWCGLFSLFSFPLTETVDQVTQVVFIARQHAMHAERDTALTIPSVCLSVCLSVCPVPVAGLNDIPIGASF